MGGCQAPRGLTAVADLLAPLVGVGPKLGPQLPHFPADLLLAQVLGALGQDPRADLWQRCQHLLPVICAVKMGGQGARHRLQLVLVSLPHVPIAGSADL